MSTDVTRLISAVEEGDAHASEELLPLVYGELRRLAAQKMAGERAGHTLQPTALVNEAWVKLAGNPDLVFEDRRAYLVLASRAMRQVLVDHARARSAAKRGGGLRRVTLDSKLGIDGGADVELLDLNRALDRLAELDLLTDQQVTAPGDDNQRIASFVGVNAEKLNELSADTLKELHQNGFLSYIFAHLFSLENWNRLLAKRSAMMAAAGVPAAGVPAAGDPEIGAAPEA